MWIWCFWRLQWLNNSPIVEDFEAENNIFVQSCRGFNTLDLMTNFLEYFDQPTK